MVCDQFKLTFDYCSTYIVTRSTQNMTRTPLPEGLHMIRVSFRVGISKLNILQTQKEEDWVDGENR